MSTQMDNLKKRYGVTTERDLCRVIAREWTEETGEKYTIRDAELMLDGMLEAEYQRIEGGAYDDSEHEARLVSEGDAIADRWYDQYGG